MNCGQNSVNLRAISRAGRWHRLAWWLDNWELTWTLIVLLVFAGIMAAFAWMGPAR